MSTRYSMTCPHENCDWIGIIIPSRIQGSKADEIVSPQKAWFECPRCLGRLEVEFIEGGVKVMPVTESQHDGSKKDAIPSLPSKRERAGDVRIITFAAGRGCRMEDVIAKELSGLNKSESECHLLLDFTNVTSITSADLGTLIGLHKKMKVTGGRLTLFNLNLQVFEVFSITRLEEFLEICR